MEKALIWRCSDDSESKWCLALIKNAFIMKFDLASRDFYIKYATVYAYVCTRTMQGGLFGDGVGIRLCVYDRAI